MTRLESVVTESRLARRPFCAEANDWERSADLAFFAQQYLSIAAFAAVTCAWVVMFLPGAM